jgi:hypothetical protein
VVLVGILFNFLISKMVERKLINLIKKTLKEKHQKSKKEKSEVSKKKRKETLAHTPKTKKPYKNSHTLCGP